MQLYSVRCSRQVRQPTLKFLVALLVLSALFPSLRSSAFGGNLASNGDAIDEHALFRAVGAMYGLDPDLFEAIAIVESHNDARAISSKGAMGLMQLMPTTVSRFKVVDPFDPVESALGAARLLDHLREQQTCEDIPKLLAAYNAGEGAVKQYHGIPPYAETRKYVRTVLRLYLLAASPEGSRLDQPETQKLVEPKTTTSNERASGDQAVLDQLAELKRQREAAGAGR
jgi:soluble lytic murein transglycosylase-like protein